MKPRQSLVVLLLLTGLACASRATPTTDRPTVPASETASLTITVFGLKSVDGEVMLALFGSAESFNKRTHPVAAGRVAPDNGTAAWQIENLPPGTYALAVYHDLNGNGKLDRKTLGPPDEPYGFSNDARGTFGPPRFDQAAIEVGSGNRAIEIRLRQ